MASGIKIFEEFRRLSQILTLYNRENFHVSSVDRKRKIVVACVFSILLIMLGLLLVSTVWDCFDYNFAISKAAFSISVTFILFQLWSIYISMSMNNREIIQTIDHLQEVINK